MRRAAFILLGGLLALASFAGTTSAQNPDGFERCGDPELVLVFLNPDLKVQDDGFVHASGTFFIQFQARGERALDVETLKFSFGKAAPGATCETPEWITGGYLKNFRADYDWEDGFFIPINTCNVPDGEYAVAVSAYDEAETEMVRYYTRAIVENGPGDDKQERCANPDGTQPWPMVLPGDGERFDGGQGLYVEVGEAVSEVQAWVNGKRVVLTEGLGPERDDDLVPDLGYAPDLRDSSVANAQLEKRRYPAFTWDGIVGAGDVVKVRAVDLWGNVAEKVVHVGDPTIGGRASLAAPEFELRIPVTDMTADANGTATYNVTYATRNAEGLHADLYVRGEDGGELPPGIGYRLKPNHVMMGGNRELAGEILLVAEKGATPGTYRVQFAVSYLSGETREEKLVPLTFRVHAPPERAYEDETAGTDEEIAKEQVAPRVGLDDEASPQDAPAATNDAPLPGLAAVAGALALAALARGRRRA